MSYLAQLIESEGTQNFLYENSALVESNIQQAGDFYGILREFIFSNVKEFIGESAEDTVKNVRVFCEVATSQFFAEISKQNEAILEQEMASRPSPVSVDDYL